MPDNRDRNRQIKRLEEELSSTTQNHTNGEPFAGGDPG
jgi:hypothetical protein